MTMRRVTVRASEDLFKIKGVRNFGSHIGRAEVADEVVGPNFTELWISIDPDQADPKATMARIQKVIDDYPGLYRDVLTYLKERIKEVLTGAGATVVVRIFGPDLDVLRAKAQEVKSAMEKVDGATNLKVEAQVLVPRELEIRVRPDAAARVGLTPGDVRRAATTLVKGLKVGELYQGQKVYDVAVWGVPSVRDDVTAVRRLAIETPTGGHVPLGDVLDRGLDRPEKRANEIKPRGAPRGGSTSRATSSRASTSARSPAPCKEKVSALPFEREYHPEFLGEYAAREESRRRLLALSALSLIGILLIIYIDFRSIRLTALVFLTLPFALIGGVMGAQLTGGVLSLGSLVGFVTVLGIARPKRYHAREPLPAPRRGGRRAVWSQASSFADRRSGCAPILMTALRHGPRPRPLGDRRQQAGPRDRTPHGRRDLGRVGDVDRLEPLPHAGGFYAAFGKGD